MPPPFFIHLLSFNVETDTRRPNSKQNSEFLDKVPFIEKIIQELSPLELLFFQEVPKAGVDYFTQHYPTHYICYGAKRNRYSQKEKNDHLVLLLSKEHFLPPHEEVLLYHKDSYGDLSLIVRTKERTTGRDVLLFNVHIRGYDAAIPNNPHKPVGDKQTKALIDTLETLATKEGWIVGGGDLNETAANTRVRLMKEHLFIPDPCKQETEKGSGKKIDFLFQRSREFSLAHSFIKEWVPSDHYPLYAILTLA